MFQRGMRRIDMGSPECSTMATAGTGGWREKKGYQGGWEPDPVPEGTGRCGCLQCICPSVRMHMRSGGPHPSAMPAAFSAHVHLRYQHPLGSAGPFIPITWAQMTLGQPDKQGWDIPGGLGGVPPVVVLVRPSVASDACWSWQKVQTRIS